MQNHLLIKLMMREPYRLYFPWGILGACLGVLYWPGIRFFPDFFAFPAYFHHFMMVYIFLWFHVQGFLMTALPRFLKSEIESKGIFLLQFGGNLLLFCSIFFWNTFWIYFCFFLSFFTFLIFLTFVLKQKKRRPVPEFIFIPYALLAIFCATLINLFQLEPIWSNILFYQAALIFFILGVGGRLIPNFLGVQVIRDEHAWYRNYLQVFATLVALSFCFDFLDLQKIGHLLRAVLLLSYFFFPMNLHRAFKKRLLGFWSLSLAYLLLPWTYITLLYFESSYRIALTHQIFLGSFNVILFWFSTRVILAHGGLVQKMRGKRFFPLQAVVFIMYFSMMTRVSADFLPKIYINHLSYAVFLWCLGLIVYMINIMPKIISRP